MFNVPISLDKEKLIYAKYKWWKNISGHTGESVVTLELSSTKMCFLSNLEFCTLCIFWALKM